MSTADLERELARWRDPGGDAPPSGAARLSVPEALGYRNAGNLPDSHGRTLRLVLYVEGPRELASLSRKRLLYEPDYHEAPNWRRPGSAHVNIVPLRSPGVAGDPKPWWEDPLLGALEEEWRAGGTVAGIRVPGPYRSFVYKTVISLRATGKEITPEAVADSIARWVPPEEASRLRTALLEANR
jgi:hypothetical protein